MIYTKDMIKQKMERRAQLNKRLKIIYIPIIVILLLSSLSILYQKFIQKTAYIDIFGYKTFMVLTGSMEPSIKVGDIVLIKNVSKEDIKEGDVITFAPDNTSQTVTHRVIELVQENGETFYKTKGDNNNSPDSDLVSYKNIVGKLSLKISHLGLIINSIATTGGIALITIIVIINWSHSSKKNDRILAREEIRKRCNVYKYGKDTKDIDDTV